MKMTRKMAKEVRKKMGITPSNGYSPKVCGIVENQLCSKGLIIIKPPKEMLK